MLNVGRFQVLAEIGHGASGAVFLGRQPDLDRAVAIKRLAPELAQNDRFLDSFRAEAQVMSRLNHPNCVAIYDFVETEDGAFLVCEYIDGASLRDVVNTARRLSPEQSLGVLKGALSGLGYAHGLGLVHRDVKPENMLADREGTSKLADFGLAVFRTDVADSAQVAGTPVYMSPEQARGRPVDHRSDIYACGVVLFEFLAGRPPYQAPNSLALVSMHVNDPVPDPRRYDRKLSVGLAQMTMRALAKDPAQRQQTAAEFLAELERHATAAYGEDWESRSTIKALVAAAAVGAAVLAGLGPGTATARAAAQVGGANTGTEGGTTVGGGPGAGGSAPAGGRHGGGGGTSPGGGAGTGAPLAAAAGGAARPGWRPGRPAVAIAVSVIAALVVATAGLAVARKGPFAPSTALPTALAASFGAAATTHGGALTGSAAAGAPTFAPLDDGSVAETVVLTQPARVDLGFSFCDSFVCGTSENLDCVGNLYIPRFGDSLLLTFQLSPPPGSRLRDTLISGGSTPDATVAHTYIAAGGATSGAGSLLDSAPKLSPDGSLKLDFPVPWKAELSRHYKPAFKQVCGFTPDERAAFSARFGTTYTPPYPYVTVIAHWTRPNSSSGKHTVTVNGSARTVNYAVPAPAATPVTATVFRQDDSRWGSQKAGSSDYARRGTVPTALASLLSAFGGTQDPPAIGRELLASGAWKADTGSDWAGLAAFVRTKQLDAVESDMLAATHAGKSALFLMSYTTAAGAESVVVVTGYDPGADRFSVIDPTLGATRLSWDDIANGDPWVLAVSRPAVTS